MMGGFLFGHMLTICLGGSREIIKILKIYITTEWGKEIYVTRILCVTTMATKKSSKFIFSNN